MTGTPGPWDEWPQPWTEERARKRYVEGGDGISLPEVAILAGKGCSTVCNWSARAHVIDEETGELVLRTWPKQRKKFEDEARILGTQKSKELIAKKYAQRVAAATDVHLDAWDKLQKVSAKWPEYLLSAIEAAENDQELTGKAQRALEKMKEVGGKNPHVAFSNSLGSAIAGTRTELNMNALQDPQVLEKQAQMQGYKLVPADPEELDED